MKLKTELLQELSNLFVQDLRSSQYYQQLSAEERNALERGLAREASRGGRPLVPGAHPDDLESVRSEAEDQLGIQLPPELLAVLESVDGFSENGVTLYGADQDPEHDQAYGASIVAENLCLWASMPELAEKYLFLGDSDLCYFAWEIESDRYAALSRSTLKPVHYFESIDGMINDMLSQALRIPQTSDPANEFEPPF
jgi:hypothetical protein